MIFPQEKLTYIIFCTVVVFLLVFYPKKVEKAGKMMYELLEKIDHAIDEQIDKLIDKVYYLMYDSLEFFVDLLLKLLRARKKRKKKSSKSKHNES